MKSLQVLTPARKCLFNCPFCIAKTHEHHNLFDNNYKDKYDFWKDNYIKILNTYTDLKTVVITGTNEPMQDQDYVEEVIKITRENRPDIQIELQTRIYK
jgi:organic radical activating enzyme